MGVTGSLEPIMVDNNSPFLLCSQPTWSYSIWKGVTSGYVCY